MNVTIIPIVIGAFGMVTKCLLKGLEDLKLAAERRPSNNCIFENGRNTEKSPGDLRRLAVAPRPSAYAEVRNSNNNNNNNNNNKISITRLKAVRYFLKSRKGYRNGNKTNIQHIIYKPVHNV